MVSRRRQPVPSPPIPNGARRLPTPRQVFLRRLSAIATTIVIAAVVAYASWPWWSAALVRAALARAGIAVEELVLRRPGLHALHIDTIALRQSADARRVELGAALDVLAVLDLDDRVETWR